MSSTSWKYLGLAMAPTMILALPKGNDMFEWELKKRYMPGTEGDEPVEGDESDDEEDEEVKTTPTPIPTASSTPSAIAETKVTTLPVAHQTPAEETREHWTIAIGSVGEFSLQNVSCNCQY
jgi:hypothetical protein